MFLQEHVLFMTFLFLFFLLFLFVFFSSNLFFPCVFSKEREKRHGYEWQGSGEDLGGDEGVETI